MLLETVIFALLVHLSGASDEKSQTGPTSQIMNPAFPGPGPQATSASRQVFAALTEAGAAADARALFAEDGFQLTTLVPGQPIARHLQGGLPVAALIDLDLPDGAGWSLLNAMQAEIQGVDRFPFPVVAISRSVAERIRALRFGVHEVLERPFETTELLLRTRAALVRAGRHVEALQGELDFYPLSELLQGVERNLWTGTILLSTVESRARIGLREGRILRASCGALHGIEALRETLDFGRGRFALDPGILPTQNEPLIASVRHLLLDLASVSFELEARLEHLPEDDEELLYVGGGVRLLEEPLDLAVDAVVERLRANGPTSLTTLFLAVPAARQRLRLVAAILREQGVIAVHGADRPPPALVPAAHATVEAEGFATLVLYSPSVAPHLASLLAALPAHSLRSPSGGTTVELQLEGTSVAGSSRIKLEPLAFHSVSEIFHDAARARRVVLWLGNDLAAQGVPLRLLQAAARHAEELTIAAEALGEGVMLAAVGDRSRWNVVESDLTTVASLLSRPFAPPDAAGLERVS